MTYFEVQERLECLEQFYELFKEYIEFTNREKNPAADIIRNKMQPLISLTVDSLRRVNLGTTVLRDAPARGGLRLRINLIRAMFREHLVDRFQLDDETPMRILENGIARYKARLWRERVQLFNPLFWLYHFADFLARIPIMMMAKAGHDTTSAENSRELKIYIVLVQLIVFYLAFRWIGLTEQIFAIFGI